MERFVPKSHLVYFLTRSHTDRHPIVIENSQKFRIHDERFTPSLP